MRGVLGIAAVAIVLGLVWWLAQPRPREGAGSAAPVAEQRAGEVELVEPAHRTLEPAATVETAVARDLGERDRRTQVDPGRSPEPPRHGAVHGRLVVAETGDRIDGAFSVQLRTLDLERKESLRTRSDGTFTSAGEFASGVLLASVEDGNGRELADHESPFDPASEDEWLVAVPTRAYPTGARGRVVDRRGEPLVEARVQLVPLEPDRPYAEAETVEDGSFSLAGLRAGVFRLHVQGIWARSEPLEVRLHAGPNDLGEIVLAEPAGAGLNVRFETEDGDWPSALLTVRSKASPYEVLYGTGLAEERGGGVYVQRIDRIPPGPCTLAIEGEYGSAFEPSYFELTPPVEVVVRVRRVEDAGPVLRARDAESGAALRTFQLWNRKRGIWQMNAISHNRVRPPDEAWVAQIHVGGADSWVLLANGYRALRGTNDLARDGVIEVALEHGYGHLLVFEDVEGDSLGSPGFPRRRVLLEDVEVRVGRELLGTSDLDGQVLLSRPEDEEQLEYRLPGWRVVTQRDHSPVLRIIGLARSR